MFSHQEMGQSNEMSASKYLLISEQSHILDIRPSDIFLLITFFFLILKKYMRIVEYSSINILNPHYFTVVFLFHVDECFSSTSKLLESKG